MKHNIMKRTLAGVMAFLCVAAYMPANVGTGGVFGGAAITASASHTFDVRQVYHEINAIAAGDTIDGYEDTWDNDYICDYVTVITSSGDTLVRNGSSWTADKNYIIVDKEMNHIDVFGNPAYSQYEYADVTEFIFTVEDADNSSGSGLFDDQQTDSGFIWGLNTINDMYVSWNSSTFEKNGITVSACGDEPSNIYNGRLDINGSGYIEFAASESVGNINKIVIHYDGGDINNLSSEWYNDTEKQTLMWRGGKDSVKLQSGSMNINVKSIEFSVGGPATPTYYYWNDAFISGSTVVDGSLLVMGGNWSWIRNSGTTVVINGDLTIEGEDTDLVVDDNSTLIVNGDLTINGSRAELMFSYSGTVIVNGNVHSEGYIYAYPNQHPMLIVKGSIDDESKVYSYVTKYTNTGINLTGYVPGNCEHNTYFLNGDTVYALADGTIQESSLDDVTYAVPQHTYGQPVWTWSADNSTVSAKFTCSKCSHNETVEAVVTSEISEPTYTAAGKAVYTAKATFDGTEYTTSKEVAIPQLTLTHHNAVAPSCTEEGTLEYWHDEANDRYFLADSGENETTADGIIAPATGHSYGSPEWTNNTDGSVTAIFTCDKCGETKTGTVTAAQMQTLMSMSGMVTKTWNWANDYSTASVTLSNIPAQALALINDADLRNEIAANGITVQAVVTSKDVAATCTTPGQKIYTAAVYTLTDTKTVDVSNAPGHTYGAPEWHWNEDFTQATATFTCEKGDSTESEEAVVTSDKQDGKTIYTATVTFNGQKYTDVQKVSTAPVTLITAQPQDVTITRKQNVTFSVEAVEGCTYQWYYRKGEDGKWLIVRNNGTSASYTTVGSSDRNGWQFCCKVMKGSTSVLSDVATLNYQRLITAQPEDVTISGKQDVTFTVESIEDCTYQWFYRKSATSNWIRVSNGGTAASYTTAGQNTRDGWQFCCKVMKNGESVLSDVATLNYQSLITAQPEDVTISTKQNVTFTVASEEGCTYEWYYRWGEGKPWIKVTNKGTSASYTTVGQNTRDGWQFCCKVIKGDGSELSEIATLHAEY